MIDINEKEKLVMKKTLVALGILMALVVNAQTTFASCGYRHHKHIMKHHHYARPLESYQHKGCPCTDPCPCKKVMPCPCGAACPIAAPCPCQPAYPCGQACPCAPSCNDCCD